MPTLDELRRWAKGEAVESIEPRAEPRNEVAKPALERGQPRRGKYKLNFEGTDALLQFGQFRNECLSEMVKTKRGRVYLRWILEHDFDEDLKRICRYQLELVNER